MTEKSRSKIRKEDSGSILLLIESTSALLPVLNRGAIAAGCCKWGSILSQTLFVSPRDPVLNWILSNRGRKVFEGVRVEENEGGDVCVGMRV